MPEPTPTSTPRATTVLALGCIALVTVATSPGGGHSGESAANANFSGERQRLEVQILPVEDRLAPFSYDGSHHLQLRVYMIDIREVSGMRWSASLTEPDSEPLLFDGGFLPDGEQVTEDDGVTYGDPVATIGRLCTAGERAADGCLPCGLEKGCTLTVEFDRCHPHGSADGDTSVEVRIVRADGSAFENECAEGDDATPCRALDEWLSLESGPAEAGLCPQ
jgi:hypothetical protein